MTSYFLKKFLISFYFDSYSNYVVRIFSCKLPGYAWTKGNSQAIEYYLNFDICIAKIILVVNLNRFEKINASWV